MAAADMDHGPRGVRPRGFPLQGMHLIRTRLRATAGLGPSVVMWLTADEGGGKSLQFPSAAYCRILDPRCGSSQNFA